MQWMDSYPELSWLHFAQARMSISALLCLHSSLMQSLHTGGIIGVVTQFLQSAASTTMLSAS